jgi:hypothetical protein
VASVAAAFGVAGRDALCGRLRGEDVPLSATMMALARHHRIHLVLAATASPGELPGLRATSLAAELREAVLIEMARLSMTRDVLNRLGIAGVDTLLLKGAGIAYTLYPFAHLRPRQDLDVLIAAGAIEPAERALLAGGWTRLNGQDSEPVTTQRHYALSGPAGFVEHLDLHWKVAIPQLFRDAVSFHELLSHSAPISVLGPHARTLSTTDALFIACLHRVAHHRTADSLLWLWDIHLLASGLTADERSQFVQLATRTSMRAICARGLESAFARFHTWDAVELIATLDLGLSETPEPSSRFLSGDLNQVDLLRSDLETLPGWRERIDLLSGHLFPPAAYVQAAYPRWPKGALPLAYLHRIARGAPKWFRRPGSRDSHSQSERLRT